MVTKALMSANNRTVVLTTTDGFIIPVPLSKFRKLFTLNGRKKLFTGRVRKIKGHMRKIKKAYPKNYKNMSVFKQYISEITIIGRLTR